jgi:type IV secretion system protein VirB6
LLYGLGLYLVIGTPDSVDPNSSPQTQKNPMSLGFFNKHLFAPNSNWSVSTVVNSSSTTGQPGENGASGQDANPPGQIVIQASQVVSQNDSSGSSGTVNNSDDYAGGSVYLKILDNFYGDNYGGYLAKFRAGAMDPHGPFATIGEIFENTLSNSVKSAFTSFVTNPQYVFIVRVLITIYISIMGVMFALGMLTMTQKDLLARIFKLAIVSALVSDKDSWDFFNTRFFSLFTDGLSEIVSIVTSVLIGNLGGKDNSAIGAFVFFDQLMRIFFSIETQAKIVSLISIWVGFYMIPIIYFGILYFGIIVCKTFIYYLTSLMIINLLLMLAPLYFCFILFNITKPLFDAWLEQLISYTIQPIIYITALMMVSLMIINEFQKIMGYGVCWQDLELP